MKYLNGTLGILKNKYFLASAFFVIWMTFFDEKDWGLLFEKKAKLSDLEKSEKHLDAQIVETRAELNMLKTNAQTIEKYARERYYMKKDNEDLFIVNSEKK